MNKNRSDEQAKKKCREKKRNLESGRQGLAPLFDGRGCAVLLAVLPIFNVEPPKKCCLFFGFTCFCFKN